MKADLLELGKRAVACKGWRWMPGMAYTRRGKFHSVSGDFLASGGTYDETCIPDFTDPATLGCLLALVREAWADPRIHAAPALYSHEPPPEYQYTISHWHVYSPGPYTPLTEPPKCAVTGKTEAEALVAALEVAP